MVQYCFDVNANRIYNEGAEGVLLSRCTQSLERLLPQTRPGFTVLIDLSKLTQEHMMNLMEDHRLLQSYGAKRCAYLSPDYGALGTLIKELRKRAASKIERGYFTRLDDALRFLTEGQAEFAT
jgi:hypothetical protein